MAVQLVSAFVVSQLDYGNATLSGLPQSTLTPLQRVLNAAAHLVCDVHPCKHVTSALIDLHWLPVAAYIELKICVLEYQSLNSTAPAYIPTCYSQSPHFNIKLICALWQILNCFKTSMLILLYFIVAFLVHIAYVSVNSWSSSHVSCIVC